MPAQNLEEAPVLCFDHKETLREIVTEPAALYAAMKSIFH
jgi:hypothetical protein